jgi:plastocyanin domain-containing protein
MTCGSSLYLLAVSTTVIVLICLEAEWFLLRNTKRKKEDEGSLEEGE